VTITLPLSMTSATARRTALTVIALLAIGGAYALALLDRPAAQPYYGGYRFAADTLNSAASPGAGFALSHQRAMKTAGSGSSSSLPPYIIRTGDITVRLKAKSVIGAKKQLLAMLRAFTGSYVASDSVYDHNRFVDLQIEVPAADFPTVMTRLENNFGKPQSQSTSTQDVGLQVVDLNARLTNLEAQRLALLKLFGKATSVSDTVKVENVLSGVEGQIEQTKSQIKYLDHQIAMSTISVEFQAKNAVTHHTTNKVFNAFGTAGNGILNVIAGAIIVVGYAIPLSICGLALYALGLGLVKLFRRRRSTTVPATA